MSVVALSGPEESSVTIQDLRQSAAENRFHFGSQQDEDDYLALLRATDATIRRIDSLPLYVDETVKPQPSSVRIARATNPTSAVLNGRTVAVKDTVSVVGLPMTVGTFPQLVSADDEYPISPIDATVVRQLLAAGAIITGTANCENYATGPLSYCCASGPVDNPWLPGYTCGGSNSGSASLVALENVRRARSESNAGPFNESDGVDIAIGTDQGGSVRIPTSYTGIYGLKPTHGLVPYTGIHPLGASIDHCGILTRNLIDMARVLGCVAGYDGLDTRMTPESPLVGKVKPYTSLLEQSTAFTAPGLSTEVADTVRSMAVDRFTRAGAMLEEVSAPMHSLGPAIWTAATRINCMEDGIQGRPTGKWTYHLPHLQPRWPPNQEMYELLTATNPAVVNLILGGTYVNKAYSAQAMVKAQTHCLELRAAYDAVFQHVDILVTPTAPTVAMKHPLVGAGQRSIMDKIRLAVGSTSNTCPFNVSGHPALAVPCGWGDVPGERAEKLPIGMQLVGRRFKDDAVLQAAAMFETGEGTSTAA